MITHPWTEDEDLVAFYLSRHGIRFLGVGEATIAKALSARPLPDGGRAVQLPEASLRMRVGNFDHLDGRAAGLPHYAGQSRRTYEKYKNASVLELRPLVIQVLGRTVKNGVERIV
jgi:hypothetical protein